MYSPDSNTCRPRLMHGAWETISCKLQLGLLLVITSSSDPIAAALCRLSGVAVSSRTGSAESLGGETRLLSNNDHTAVVSTCCVAKGKFDWKGLSRALHSMCQFIGLLDNWLYASVLFPERRQGLPGLCGELVLGGHGRWSVDELCEFEQQVLSLMQSSLAPTA